MLSFSKNVKVFKQKKTFEFANLFKISKNVPFYKNCSRFIKFWDFQKLFAYSKTVQFFEKKFKILKMFMFQKILASLKKRVWNSQKYFRSVALDIPRWIYGHQSSSIPLARLQRSPTGGPEFDPSRAPHFFRNLHCFHYSSICC